MVTELNMVLSGLSSSLKNISLRCCQVEEFGLMLLSSFLVHCSTKLPQFWIPPNNKNYEL